MSERREAIRAAISDAYYESRNEGQTMEAAADRATDAVMALTRKIGILAYDNGDYNAYVGYFDDPKALQRAVDKLHEERRDRYEMEPANAEVHVEMVRVVPDYLGDDFLDLLVGMLEDAGVEIETARDAKERREEEERERAEEEEEAARPIVPSPGQEEIGL